jgi:phospholipid/cholesterol/gamma-HCH transport system ATP-binding protein
MSVCAQEVPFFEVQELHQTFGKHAILRGVSFSVPRGGTTVILGGSGAGKSVLLKHLNGLHHPLSGVVRVEGTDISTLSERELTPIRRKIGVLFQDGALFDSMDVGRNVAFPLREGGEKNEEKIRARVAHVLDLVGLKGQEEKMPDVLSGGMRKRVSLARAIAGSPDCLLYDEPTAGLDPILSANIAGLIARMKSELRLTSVLVTHHLGVMRAVADQVIFLKEGRIHFAGSPADLEKSTDPAIEEFLSADRIDRGIHD